MSVTTRELPSRRLGDFLTLRHFVRRSGPGCFQVEVLVGEVAAQAEHHARVPARFDVLHLSELGARNGLELREPGGKGLDRSRHSRHVGTALVPVRIGAVIDLLTGLRGQEGRT